MITLLTDAIIEHHAITQLVLEALQLEVLQPEELEHFQPLVLVLLVLLVSLLRIRLCYTRCCMCCSRCCMCCSRCRMNCDDRSVMLERSMAGMSRSLALQLCRHRSLVLVHMLLRMPLGMLRSLARVRCMAGMRRHNDS